MGLDLEGLYEPFLESLCAEVLENIDLDALLRVAACEPKNVSGIRFCPLQTKDKRLAVVSDENFSFLYEDNIEFLKEVFGSVGCVCDKRRGDKP